MVRKGLGRGKGKGYKNLQGKDPRVHSDSAKGMKQPQNIKCIDALKTASRLENLKVDVKMAYGDIWGLKFRDLDYRSPEMNIQEAKEVVKLVESYNEFNGKKCSEIISSLSPKEVSSIQFGRENSVALYINLPYNMSDSEKIAFEKKLKSKFADKRMSPDEFDAYDFLDDSAVEYKEAKKFRLWWD